MANSANSTVSVQKPSTSNSSCSSQHKQLERKKSCDTVCSSNTSCFLQKRKSVHPLAASVRFGNKTNSNVVKQRVLSAKLLKLRSIQTQLNDANFHLAELAKENRALRTLQRRQDKALKNYEGVDAELPRLIKSYEEELRVLQDKNKNLKRGLKEAADQLKIKDDELNTLRSQLKHLMTLTKDKHLGEREKLKRELDEAKEQIKEYENKISVLNRRLMLESKNSKYKLNNEIGKHKQCQKELAHALAELNRNGQFVPENGDLKQPIVNRKRILTQRPVLSSVSLKAESTPELLAGPSSVDDESTTDLHLDPVRKKSDDSIDVPRGILKSPAESVKARLSAGRTKSQLSSSLRNLSIDEIDEKYKPKSAKSIFALSKNPTLLRTNSNHKLEILSENLQNTLKKTASRDVEDTDLGDYCLEVVKTVKDINTVVDKHKSHYQSNKLETIKILDTLKKADIADSKIRKNKEDNDEVKVNEKDMELVNKIWFEEYNFQKSRNNTDRNGNVHEVSHEDKKKLLATLKAIDNGEVVENLDVGFTKKNRKDVMKELFGRGSQ